MNQNYSKQNTLLKSIRKILIDDSSDTGVEVREISFYVSNRIVQSMNPVSLTMPQITLDVGDGLQQQTLPSGEYYIIIRCWAEVDSETPNDILNNLATRVIFLLHNKYNQLNTQFPNENLRCRLITKQSNIKNDDSIRKLISRTILFRIVADDEILVCN